MNKSNDATGNSGTTFCSTAAHEGPIIFSGEMVNAILDGRKTQTRRAIDRMKGFRCKQFGPSSTKGYDWHFRCQRGLWQDMDRAEVISRCPYGQVGDRLWVREACKADQLESGMRIVRYTSNGDYWPIAEGQEAFDNWFNLSGYGGGNSRQVPSIHMPRWASRITLEITDVRIEQLQDISRGDCMAEGCPFQNIAKESYPDQWFFGLWSAINGVASLKQNPWVWVVEFRRV